MIVSTKGRYALCVLIDLAELSPGGGYIPMGVIAEKQKISLKYLEKLLPLLVGEGLIEGVRGKCGGYRLTKAPEEYRVGDILRLMEGDLAPVSCVGQDSEACPSVAECRTYPMWQELHEMINQYLDGITLRDLMRKEPL